MMEARDRAEELGELASALPNGPTRVAMLEEAVQLADSIQDLDLAYALRKELMEAGTFSGRSDVMLVAFSWCLAQFDRNPDRFDQHELLWRYKWVVENGWKFPQISRARLEALLADMERRFLEAGATVYAVELERRQLFMHFGERGPAEAAHAEFSKCRRDVLSDCIACVANKNCDYYCFQGNWKKALEAAQPVLDGRMVCMEQPHVILANVLLPLLHLGRADEARAYQRQGYQLVSQGVQFVRPHAQHLRFLTLAGDQVAARRMLERHLPGALEAQAADEAFEFLLAARLWTERTDCRRSPQGEAQSPGGTTRRRCGGESRRSGVWRVVHVESA